MSTKHSIYPLVAIHTGDKKKGQIEEFLTQKDTPPNQSYRILVMNSDLPENAELRKRYMKDEIKCGYCGLNPVNDECPTCGWALCNDCEIIHIKDCKDKE